MTALQSPPVRPCARVIVEEVGAPSPQHLAAGIAAALAVSHANAPNGGACARAVERVTRERAGQEVEG